MSYQEQAQEEMWDAIASQDARRENWCVMDRRDHWRVANGFGSEAEALEWIARTDRRGSGEFYARRLA